MGRATAYDPVSGNAYEFNPQDGSLRMEDWCPLCGDKFIVMERANFDLSNTDNAVCPQCRKKTLAEQEKIHHDNMFGQAKRLRHNAARPRKIGGIYSGGGIETPYGKAAWQDAAKAWEDKFGIARAYDPEQHQKIRRQVLLEENTDLL